MSARTSLFLLLTFLFACKEPNTRPATYEDTPQDLTQELQTQPEVRIDSQALQEENGQELLINRIRKEFQRINASDELYIDTIALEEQEKGGAELIAYHNAVGELKKMVAMYPGEGGKTVEEYYLNDSKLIFSFIQVQQYGRPPNMDDDTFKRTYTEKGISPKDSLMEDRYYFDEDVFMVRHVNPSGEILEEEKLDTQKEDLVIEKFGELVETLKKSENNQEETEVSQFNELVHTWMISIAEEQAFTYTYEAVDLNGDGLMEYLCGLRGRFWCGSGGCSFVILEQHAGSLKLLARGGPTYGPHLISKETVDDWYTLVLDPTIGQTQEGEEYKNYPVMVFRDSTYVQEWIDDLDPNERLDHLLDEATEVLGDDREFHKVKFAGKEE